MPVIVPAWVSCTRSPTAKTVGPWAVATRCSAPSPSPPILAGCRSSPARISFAPERLALDELQAAGRRRMLERPALVVTQAPASRPMPIRAGDELARAVLRRARRLRPLVPVRPIRRAGSGRRRAVLPTCWTMPASATPSPAAPGPRPPPGPLCWRYSPASASSAATTPPGSPAGGEDAPSRARPGAPAVRTPWPGAGKVEDRRPHSPPRTRAVRWPAWIRASPTPGCRRCEGVRGAPGDRASSEKRARL